MVIRLGETDQFQLEGTWFFIVSFQNGEMKQEDFTKSKSSKYSVIRRIEIYTEDNIPFKLYGVWHGQWKTDVFDLEPQLMKQRLSEHLEKLEKEKEARKKARKK